MLAPQGCLDKFNKLIQKKTWLPGEIVLWIFYGGCHYSCACSCYARGAHTAVREPAKCVASRNRNSGRLWPAASANLKKEAEIQISLHSDAYKCVDLE